MTQIPTMKILTLKTYTSARIRVRKDTTATGNGWIQLSCAQKEMYPKRVA